MCGGRVGPVSVYISNDWVFDERAKYALVVLLLLVLHTRSIDDSLIDFQSTSHLISTPKLLTWFQPVNL